MFNKNPDDQGGEGLQMAPAERKSSGGGGGGQGGGSGGGGGRRRRSRPRSGSESGARPRDAEPRRPADAHADHDDAHASHDDYDMNSDRDERSDHTEPRTEARPEPRPEPRANRPERGRPRDDRDDEADDQRYEARGERDLPPPNPARRPPPSASVGPADEFTLVVYWDHKEKLFVGYYAELPEMRVSAARKEQVLSELEETVETHLVAAKRRGDRLPEPIGRKEYPETIELALSQTLMRRLDTLARVERATIEKFAAELVTLALDKRFEPSGGGGPARGGNDGNRRSGGGGGGQGHGSSNRHGGGGGGQSGGRRQGRNNFQETMESRENFMEYVRNLEKGGYRKK